LNDLGANDLQRAKQTSKISRQIVAGIKAMGGEADPAHNHYLAAALHAAKVAQIPKTTVQEAIKRATSKKESIDSKTIRYEGLGPAGMAVIVEALVSNPSKTAAEVKLIFKKSGGSLGPTEYLFQHRGFVIFKAGTTGMTLEKMTEAAIDAEGKISV
jgi:transcriptional/translational regulatory protein YebC/TACO1